MSTKLTPAEIERAKEIGLDLGDPKGSTDVHYGSDHDAVYVSASDAAYSLERSVVELSDGSIVDTSSDRRAVIELYDGQDQGAVILGQPRAYHPHVNE